LSEEYQYDETNRKQNNITEMNRIVQYWCKPDWCTNGSVVQQINEAVQEYYDLSPIYQILNIKNRITSKKPSSTETSTIFTSKYIASTIFHRSTLTSPEISTTNTVHDTFSSDDVLKSTSIFTSKIMLLTTQIPNLINSSTLNLLDTTQSSDE
jgi:hypothetical protein